MNAFPVLTSRTCAHVRARPAGAHACTCAHTCARTRALEQAFLRLGTDSCPALQQVSAEEFMAAPANRVSAEAVAPAASDVPQTIYLLST